MWTCLENLYKLILLAGELFLKIATDYIEDPNADSTPGEFCDYSKLLPAPSNRPGVE